MPNFDELYKVHKNPWGSKPLNEIAEFVSEFKPGSILDIGVGDGRNTLFLAEKGFSITGLDISAEAIDLFKNKAQEIGKNVEGIVADISTYKLTKKYDNIISNYTLHFLKKEDFPRVLKDLQEHTEPGGLHLITDFTQDGPLYKPDTSHYWLKNDELKELYCGWTTIYYKEKPTLTRALDSNGKQLTQTAATIVARKS